MLILRSAIFFLFITVLQAKDCPELLIKVTSPLWLRSNLGSKISFDELSKNSRGIISIENLNKSVEFIDSGFILGLGSGSTTSNLSDKLGLIPPNEGHKHLFGTYEVRNTPDYMDFITKGTKPVVFLIPDNFFNYNVGSSIHGGIYATEQEFEWLLKNPERMKNVYFVFGAYGRDDLNNIPFGKTAAVSNQKAVQKIKDELREEGFEKLRKQRQIEIENLWPRRENSL
ncbi:MAG: hypothetical protein KA116_08710 [Proteobacteria bacterium]|nr:hypothetical protein [Pseudomonadota bacterium]